MDLTSLAVASFVAALFLAGQAAAQSGATPPEPKARPEPKTRPEPGARPDLKARPETGDPAPDEKDKAPDSEGKAAATNMAPPPSPKDKVAMKAHLDELFRRLAETEAKDWQRVQAQIIQAWNRSGSASMDLLAARADKAMEKKDFKTALLHLDDLVRLAPDFAEGWNKRATIHFMQQDYGPSLEDIARVLTLEPRHFGALSGLGIILDRIGDPKGALEAYRRAIAIHPHLPGIMDGIKKLEKQVEGQRL